MKKVAHSHLPQFLTVASSQQNRPRTSTCARRRAHQGRHPQRPSSSNPSTATSRRFVTHREPSDLRTQLDVLLHSQEQTPERRAAIYSSCLATLAQQQMMDQGTRGLLVKIRKGTDQAFHDIHMLLYKSQQRNTELKEKLRKSEQYRVNSSASSSTTYQYRSHENAQENQPFQQNQSNQPHRSKVGVLTSLDLSCTSPIHNINICDNDEEEEMLNDSRLLLTDMDRLSRPEDFIEIETSLPQDPNEPEMEGSSTHWSVPMTYVDPWLKQNDEDIEQKKREGWEENRMKSMERSTQTESAVMEKEMRKGNDRKNNNINKKKKNNEYDRLFVSKRSIGVGSILPMTRHQCVGTTPKPKLRNCASMTDPVPKRRKTKKNQIKNKKKKKHATAVVTKENAAADDNTCIPNRSIRIAKQQQNLEKKRQARTKKMVKEMWKKEDADADVDVDPAIMFEHILAVDVPIVTRLIKMLPKDAAVSSSSTDGKPLKIMETLEYVRHIYKTAITCHQKHQTIYNLPQMVLNDFTRQWGVPSLVKSKILVMLRSVRKYRVRNSDIEFFAQLLEETKRNESEWKLVVICMMELDNLVQQKRRERQSNTNITNTNTNTANANKNYDETIEQQLSIHQEGSVTLSSAYSLVAIVMNRLGGHDNDNLLIEVINQCMLHVRTMSVQGCCRLVHLWDIITQGVRHTQTRRKMTAWLEYRFRECDTNDDGFISERQFIKALSVLVVADSRKEGGVSIDNDDIHIDTRSLSVVYHDAVSSINTKQMSMRLFLMAADKIVVRSRIVSIASRNYAKADHSVLPDLSMDMPFAEEVPESFTQLLCNKSESERQRHRQHLQEQEHSATKLLSSLVIRWKTMNVYVRKYLVWCCHAEDPVDVQRGTQMHESMGRLEKELDDYCSICTQKKKKYADDAGKECLEDDGQIQKLVQRASAALFFYSELLHIISGHQCRVRRWMNKYPLHLPVISKELNDMESIINTKWKRIDFGGGGGDGDGGGGDGTLSDGGDDGGGCLLDQYVEAVELSKWQNEVQIRYGEDMKFGNWLFQEDHEDHGFATTRTDRLALFPVY